MSRSGWIAGVVLVAAAVLQAAAAPPPDDRPFKWWQSPEFRIPLRLTDAQATQIEAIYEGLLPQRLANGARVREATEKLNALLDDSAVPESAVMAQVDRVGAAEAARNKTRTIMLYRMLQVLTPEQRIRFKALHEQWKARQATRPDNGLRLKRPSQKPAGAPSAAAVSPRGDSFQSPLMLSLSNDPS